MKNNVRHRFSSAAIRFVLAGLAVLAAADAAAQDLSVERALSYGFPSGLVASADGARVAWVLDERGARNVWVAEAPEWTGRRLTGFVEDDGQEITDLQFAREGERLVYVRGGSPNRAGELPNPLSYATGVKRQIWMVPFGGGEPRLLAEGGGPQVAPDGESMVFRAAGGLHHGALPADDDEFESRVVADPRGGMGNVRWSPAGDRLLFVSNRGTHAFVGVVGLEGGPVTWIDPGVDSDGSAVWSPDGARVAFVRRPARRELVIFAPLREARPWSIRVGDPDTGASEEIFRAEQGPGSVPIAVGAPGRPTVSGGLIWAADDRLVFPWEAGGWAGLHVVAASGGASQPLDVGAFEVEAVEPSADGSELLVVSNRGDVDRRHVWRVAVDGSAPPSRVGEHDWIEWSPAFVDGGVAYLRSDATTPAHAVVHRDEGGVADLGGSVPEDYPSQAMVEPQQVIFPGADGLPVHGQLFLPPNGSADERHPAVLFFHGGSRRQMLLGFHYMGYYHHAYALNQVLASRGYVVLSVNYRSGTGYGLEFREALNYGASGASEFNDVLGAGLWLRARDDVDPHRIGLWGGSYGGYLTAMGLARASDLFAAGVDIHGVHDWNDGIRIFVPSYDPDPETERLAFESSPNASLDTWRSPVLLIHGDDDRNVFFSQTVHLVEDLRERDVHVETLVFPDEVHGFLRRANWIRAFEAAMDFFERMLGERR